MFARVWDLTLLFTRMVKIEHSIFALPFAFIGMIWAAGGWPPARVVVVLTLAMVAVRSFAMGFNRLADREIDKRNPRTQDRPLVSGALTVGQTRIFLGASAIVFVSACWFLNPVCFALSPVALIWSAFYSYSKRFTSLCHVVLGSVLGLAPLAGWLAVHPVLAPAPVILAVGVTLWVAGFDILYSCQDAEFDRTQGLHSMPARHGVETSLVLSTSAHAVTGILFLLAGWVANAGLVFMGTCVFVGVILLLEHRMISANDMSRVNFAFFTMNGFVAVLLFTGALIDILP